MTATVRCNECGSIVEVSRENNNALTLRCDCPDINVDPIAITPLLASEVPESWD